MKHYGSIMTMYYGSVLWQCSNETILFYFCSCTIQKVIVILQRHSGSGLKIILLSVCSYSRTCKYSKFTLYTRVSCGGSRR